MRCLEISLPADQKDVLTELLGERAEFWSWQGTEEGQGTLHRVLLPADEVEELLDGLESRFGEDPKFQVVILPVSALIPVPVAPEDEDEEEEEKEPGHVAREELRATLRASVEGGTVFRLTVVLSTIVATIGLVRDSPAIVIGAMVIAPLLGPNMALALATTLGDKRLLGRAARRNVEGVGIAFAMALALGVIFEADPEISQLARRAYVTPTDLVLALASGAAGALAFTSGVSATLVGVMVAVALLPPLVACALFAVQADWIIASRALLLLWANIVCINLAAVCVFLLRGVRPRSWKEQGNSVRLSRASLAIWGVSLLLALFLSWKWGGTSANFLTDRSME